jgi:class 3 adenylate cyclase
MAESNPQQRIAELEAEVARLRQQLSEGSSALFSVAGLSRSALPPAKFTIAGLEERVLLVDSDDQIRYANSGMAQLLGAGDKAELLRTSISVWEGKGLIPRGLLPAFVHAARNHNSTLVSEQEIDLGDAQGKPATPHTLRFVANNTEGRVQIVVQDVTQLRNVERSFARYVSPDIISQLLTMPAEDLKRVQRRKVSVMFTDLRGFTRVFEQLSPADVSSMLDSHFELAVGAVHEFGGTVDKLMGDGMMAIFGAPLPQPDYSLRCLAAALSMQEKHPRWVEKQQAAGQPTPGLGVGIATGEVVVGNIGAPERLDFTAIGLVVSIAARLCAAAENGQVLAETQTYKVAKEEIKTGVGIAVPRMEFAAAGSLQLKNVSFPVEVVNVKAAQRSSQA